MNFDAAKVSFSVLLSLVICVEVFPSSVSTVLLELVCWPVKGSQPKSVCFLKLAFGQLTSLSCFIVDLKDASAGHKEEGKRVSHPDPVAWDQQY